MALKRRGVFAWRSSRVKSSANWQGCGAPADIILIHPDRPFVFDADSMLSRSKNSALDGRRLQGRAELTMVSGKIVHRAAA